LERDEDDVERNGEGGVGGIGVTAEIGGVGGGGGMKSGRENFGEMGSSGKKLTGKVALFGEALPGVTGDEPELLPLFLLGRFGEVYEIMLVVEMSSMGEEICDLTTLPLLLRVDPAVWTDFFVSVLVIAILLNRCCRCASARRRYKNEEQKRFYSATTLLPSYV